MSKTHRRCPCLQAVLSVCGSVRLRFGRVTQSSELCGSTCSACGQSGDALTLLTRLPPADPGSGPGRRTSVLGWGPTLGVAKWKGGSGQWGQQHQQPREETKMFFSACSTECFWVENFLMGQRDQAPASRTPVVRQRQCFVFHICNPILALFLQGTIGRWIRRLRTCLRRGTTGGGGG